MKCYSNYYLKNCLTSSIPYGYTLPENISSEMKLFFSVTFPNQFISVCGNNFEVNNVFQIQENLPIATITDGEIICNSVSGISCVNTLS